MVYQRLERLRENIRSVYLGSAKSVDLLLVGLLARGHVLIEDVPGVGKTVLARSLAKSIDCRFARIQLTPDLMPSDVLGVSVYDSQTKAFEFKPGPIFNHIVLADEINRTTPRTQSALLEAMAEEQVSVENETRHLERPFMLVATQNPFEFEGTYYLPENQLDRFIVKIGLGYPDRAAEVVEMQDRVPDVRMEPAVIDYILDLVDATRHHEDLHLGVSPRGTLALTGASQAAAVLAGREYVTPDDVKKLFLAVCAHRVLSKTYLHNGDANATTRVLEAILNKVPTPR